MMGRTHATAGAVATLAVLPLLQQHGLAVSPAGVVAAMIAGAGAAMLPDFDHRHATVAQTLGPISRGLAIGVETVSGGHRNGTHSILGVAVFTAAAVAINEAQTLLGLFLPHSQAQLAARVLLGLWLAFLFAVATAALRVSPIRNIRVHSVFCLLAGIALTTMTAVLPFPTDVLPWAVAIGATSHLITDMATKEGCPLLWPVSKFRFKFANLTTDHFTERVIVGPGLGLAAIWLFAQQTGLIATVTTLVT